MIWNLIVETTGLIFGALLFYRRPVLASPAADSSKADNLSVIIPARNEEQNLPILLESLRAQTWPPGEIILADDGSTDRTAAIAVGQGVRLVSIKDKPAAWQGKSWACQQGADLARGDLLLFLDADVFLEPDAIGKLLATRAARPGVISVQPFHRIRRLYEYLSFFLNLVQVAANGVGLPGKPRHAGLFGPVILISQKDYQTIGGHRGIQRSVTDDLALGRCLKKNQVDYRLFLGFRDISYRMYSGGVRQLCQGWIKNIATGATQTPPGLLFLVFVWMAACITTIIDPILAISQGDPFWIGVSAASYLLFVLQLIWAARRAGNFKWLAIVFYPLWLLAFLAIFLMSLFSKVMRRKVIWKGRKVDPCR
jgi:4,4'-diaponeurosporenoate glycosyltransferase